MRTFWSAATPIRPWWTIVISGAKPSRHALNKAKNSGEFIVVTVAFEALRGFHRTNSEATPQLLVRLERPSGWLQALSHPRRRSAAR